MTTVRLITSAILLLSVATACGGDDTTGPGLANPAPAAAAAPAPVAPPVPPGQPPAVPPVAGQPPAVPPVAGQPPAVPPMAGQPAAPPAPPAVTPNPPAAGVAAPPPPPNPTPAPPAPAETVRTLFWLDITSNRVWRADETADFGNAEVIVARTLTAPDGIAVDVEGGKLYWSNMGSLFGSGGGTLQRSNLDGTGVETIVPAGFARTPKQMQVDLDNRHAYWCDREGAKVWRSGLDGASPTVLVSDHGFEELVGIALDVPNRQIYFTDRIGKKILRTSFDIPAGETAANRTDIEELFVLPGRAMPIDLDAELESRMLYWTDRQLGSVHRAPMDMPAGQSASSRTDAETLVTGLTDTIGLSLDHDNNKMYYTELGGEVHEAALDGSGARRVARGTSATGVVIAHLPK